MSLSVTHPVSLSSFTQSLSRPVRHAVYLTHPVTQSLPSSLPPSLALPNLFRRSVAQSATQLSHSPSHPFPFPPSLPFSLSVIHSHSHPFPPSLPFSLSLVHSVAQSLSRHAVCLNHTSRSPSFTQSLSRPSRSLSHSPSHPLLTPSRSLSRSPGHPLLRHARPPSLHPPTHPPSDASTLWPSSRTSADVAASVWPGPSSSAETEYTAVPCRAQ